MDAPAINLAGITKQYIPSWQLASFTRQRRAILALNDISLTIPRGQLCGLLGTNGAGKTTLIKILATLLLPDQGTAEINGIDLRLLPVRVRALVGLVTPNERSFYWRISAVENLRFFATIYGLSGSRRRQRIEEVLQLLDMQEQRKQLFMTLSTGQRQRLSLARALLADPEILLLDEPTTGLDPVAASGYKQIIESTLVQSQGKTVLWCTHNLAEAEQLCERVVFLHQGRIVADLARGALQDRIVGQTRYTVSIDESDTVLLKKLKLPVLSLKKKGKFCWITLMISDFLVPQTLVSMIQAGIRLHACSPDQDSLEAFFKSLTQSSSGAES